MVLHIAYDDRAIHQAFASVFGEAAATLTASKTVKTRCNKRVAYSQALTHKEATCEVCLLNYLEQEESDRLLIDDLKSQLTKFQQ